MDAKRQAEIFDRARTALSKQAAFGPDINFESYGKPADAMRYLPDPTLLAPEDQARMLSTGVDVKAEDRSGTFIQVDQSVVHCGVVQEGLEVMGMADALKKYDWLDQYWWRAVEPDQDKYTARVALSQDFNGYFLRALPGIKSNFPLQACLYLHEDKSIQDVHNVIIVEEGAELNIISGCTSAGGVQRGVHVGVSEVYVKKGGRLTFTMIHNWAEDVAVRPRSGSIVEEDGLFLSNYICLKPVKTVQMYPTSWLVGPGAVARYYSILVAPPSSNLDVGSRVYLQAKGSKAESVSRTLTTGGDIMSRGAMIAEVQEVKAHLECRGLVLGETGVIDAIPELYSKVGNVDLSHEAAVGKIAEEEVEYLMSRGLSEDEATATIVRGFLNVQIMGLPQELQAEIDRAVQIGEQSTL